MSSKEIPIFDFRKAYEEAIAEDAKILSTNISLLTAKRKNVKETIDSLKPLEEQIKREFLISISSYDRTSRAFLEVQVKRLFSDLGAPYNTLLCYYESQLGKIDFSARSNMNAVLLESPFSGNFDAVNDALSKYNDKLTLVKSSLSRLLSQSNIRYISFLKNRAKALIDQLDNLGVYDEIFTKGNAHVWFSREPIQEKHEKKGTLFSFHGISSNDVDFIFYPNYLTAKEKKYYKNLYGKDMFVSYFGVGCYYDECIFRDLAVVLQNLMTGVKVTYTGHLGIELTLSE